MFKRIYIHPEMVMLCTTLTSIKASQIAYGITYRFMDMSFAKLQKGAGKHRPNKAKRMYGIIIDDEQDRQYDFSSKEEMVSFIENRTKHLMKDLQDVEAPDVNVDNISEDQGNPVDLTLLESADKPTEKSDS